MRRWLMSGAALLLVGAGPALSLRPGLWRFRDTPTSATLDGRPLHDLPVSAPSDETVCLTPADAADPARWLARDVGPSCTLSKHQTAGGVVDIAGSCPSDEGAPGALRISGAASAEHYQLRFETVANGGNGRMAFAGTMVGSRIGACR